MIRSQLKVVRYQHSKTSKFIIEGLRINRKRVRKFFNTKVEAQAWADTKTIQLKNEGAGAVVIAKSDKND